MNFKDGMHEKLYRDLIKRMGIGQDERVFCFVAAATGKSKIIDCIEDGFVDYRVLKELAAPWSESEKALLELAYQLFDGSSLFGEDGLVSDIFWSLDRGNVRVALDGIRLKYGQ